MDRPNPHNWLRLSLCRTTLKRRHDRNKGYDVYALIAVELVYYVALIIAGVSVIWLTLIYGGYFLYIVVVAGFLKGTPGSNAYGDDPLRN